MSWVKRAAADARSGLLPYHPFLSLFLSPPSRWGRAVETYGEDPNFVGDLGAAIVSGTQFGADPGWPSGNPGTATVRPVPPLRGLGDAGGGYLQAIVAAKHASFYQSETNRFGANVQIPEYDIVDSFLPSWERVIVNGHATGVMCAYPAINGVPCCADAVLLTDILRSQFGMGTPFLGGSYIQGDCGALEDISNAHHYVANVTQGAAAGLNAGADVDCGSAFPGQLALAIELGYTTESALDASLTRTITLQMLAGRFDPVEDQPYMSVPFEALGSAANEALAYESGVQGLVLLRNDLVSPAPAAPVLPLRPGGKVAVIGPHGNSTGDLCGNYFEQVCPGGTFDCVPSLLAAVTALNGASPLTTYTQGCAINDGNATGIPAAVSAAAAADVVILALGTNEAVANEGSDRGDASLPGQQLALAQAVLAVGKPTVVLIFSGSSLGIDAIVASKATALALVYAFFPGEAGGVPVANTLFGLENRWGKLPLSLYPLNYTTLLAVDALNMTAGPGRTYKYYNGPPLLYPMGFGLSYTTFNMSGDCPSSSSSSSPSRALAPGGSPIVCSVTVTNTGAVAGDEIVQVYVVPNATSIREARRAASSSSSVVDPPDPLAQRVLVAYQRVSVPVGGNVVVPFNISVAEAFSSVDVEGRRVLWPGAYALEFTNGAGAVVAVGGFEVPRLDPGGGKDVEVVRDRIVVRENPMKAGKRV